jgi:probable HAF family extracellular repeat protein
MKAFVRFLCVLSLTASCVACGGGSGSGGEALAIVAIPPLLPPTPPIANYSVLQLDPLAGDQQANAEDINDLGQIVGWSSGGTMGQTAVLWSIDQAGVVTVESLGKLPGGTFSNAQAINNNGQVVGFADGGSGTRRPFIWTETGGMRDLGVPVGLVGGQAHQINDNGQVVGVVFRTEFFSLTDSGRFAIWTVDAAGAVTNIRDLGALGGVAAAAWDNNVHGNVAGDIWYFGAARQSGFFWSEQGGVVAINNTDEALGINDNDEIVGSISYSPGGGTEPSRRTGFVWSTTGERIEVLDGIFLDMNNAGQAVGRRRVGAIAVEAIQQAFIWENGEAELLPMPENGDFSSPWSINEAGWTVGWTTDVDGIEYANLWIPNQP